MFYPLRDNVLLMPTDKLPRRPSRAWACGPPGRSLFQVAAAILFRGDGPRCWSQLPEARTLLTHQGRIAVELACSLSGLRAGDEVLMPSYNCGTEVDAILAGGARVVPYRVDANARIDAGDLRRRSTDRTRAVYVIHYFGWPQDLADVTQLCGEAGLLLIEDCALSLFSAGPGGPLGHAADAAIFSFTKSLPVPDGGALVLRDRVPDGAPMLASPSALRVLRTSLGLIGRRHFPDFSSPGARPRILERESPAPPRPDMPAGYYWDDRNRRRSISATTRGMLRQFDESAIVERRRANWLRLFERIRGLPGMRPLHDDLPPGVCPLAMSVIVDDRPRCVERLHARGIAAIPWWPGYHRRLPWDEFPDACRLKDHIVALPVNQDLDGDSMDYIAEQLAATH